MERGRTSGDGDGHEYDTGRVGDGEVSAADAAPEQEISEDIFPAIEGDEGETVEEAEESLTHVEPFVGKMDRTPESEKIVTRIEVPFRTIFVVVGTIFMIWVLLQIWSILLQVFLAFLLATALLPLVRRLQNRGMPKGAASAVVFAGLVGVVIGFFAIIVPPLIQQGQSFADNAPDYLHRFEGFINQYPSLAEQYQKLREDGVSGEVDTSALPWSQVLAVGQGFVSRVANTFFVLVMTFYLLLEGERTWKFLSRYCTPRLRFRFRRAYPEITRVVSGYLMGQAINSFSFGLFAFVSMWVLGVPEPLLLAVLAAVFDAVPIIGVPVATIPALLLALTVSWQTAVIVLILYVVYQQFENYVMVPRVFGNTLQVSSLSILVGVLVGGQLLGVIGIILSLPLTASIPVLERIWNEEVPEHVMAAEP
ncbi:MAG TPA: AI-2E family transporter [Thermomicrobiales bacterium]|nr:AI-2E family transporter [Thermomicrobiales bacterium]